MAGDAERCRELFDAECFMVVPEKPYVFTRAKAIAAMQTTARWTDVTAQT